MDYCGGDGRIDGEWVRISYRTDRRVNVEGIDNRQIAEMPIATVGGGVNTQNGEVIAIFHQYAYTGKGASIHSSPQLEWYRNKVSDRSIKVGGLQRIETADGYVIPIDFKNALPRLTLRPYTDKEWDMLPHVIMTSELEWDPTVLDHTLTDNDNWYDCVEDIDQAPYSTIFYQFGNYKEQVSVQFHTSTLATSPTELIDYLVYRTHFTTQPEKHKVPWHAYDTEIVLPDAAPNIDYELLRTTCPEKHKVDRPETPKIAPRDIQQGQPKFNLLRPSFGWLRTDTIAKTFENSTQYARIPFSTTLKKHFKSPNPALNVPRRNEDVATDYIYSNTPAIDNGSTGAQLFFGQSTHVTTAYGCKTDGDFATTLADELSLIHISEPTRPY